MRTFVLLLAAFMTLAIQAHAQDWSDFATVSMTNPTTPKLSANRLCYTDGRDLLCDGAAGLLTTSGTLQITNVSATGNVSAQKFIGDGSGLTGVSANLSETISINDLSDASSTVASGNMFLGSGSGNSITFGGRNTSVGIGALASVTLANANSAFGSYALASLTNGSGSNSAFGAYTLTNTTGRLNSAFGANALKNNTTGSSNNATGANALFTNTTGGGNVAMSGNALYAAVSDNYNIAIGYSALSSANGGSYNAALGAFAGQGTNGTSAISSSVIVGAYAGYLLSSSTENTLIGYNAASGLTTGSSNTVIGTNAAPYSNTGNSQLSIANAIWGNIGSGLGNANLIGINVASPTVSLQVSGTVSATRFVGDGSELTGISTQGDRITSGTAAAIANSSSGYISLTTGATTWGYLGSSATYLPNVNANTISSTGGIKIGTLAATCASSISGTMRYNTASNTMEYCNGSAWANMGPSSTQPVSFSVYKSANQTAGAFIPVTFDRINFDTNNNFNTGTGRFTPTVPGKYLFRSQVNCGSSGNCQAEIYKNGAVAVYGPMINIAGERSVATVILDMNGTSDYVQAYGYSSNGASDYFYGGVDNATNFSGVILAAQGGGSGGAATPAGSDTQLQLNSSGNFGASSNLTFDSSARNLAVSGSVQYGGTGSETCSSAADYGKNRRNPVSGRMQVCLFR